MSPPHPASWWRTRASGQWGLAETHKEAGPRAQDPLPSRSVLPSSSSFPHSILTTLASLRFLEAAKQARRQNWSMLFPLPGMLFPTRVRLTPHSFSGCSGNISSTRFSQAFLRKSATPHPKSVLSLLLTHIFFLLFITIQQTVFLLVYLLIWYLLTRLGCKLHEDKDSVLFTAISSGSGALPDV